MIIYDADKSEEDAWTELVSAMQDWFRADLLFLYPGPGNGNKSWHPSWTQVKTETFPKSSLSKDLLYELIQSAGAGQYIPSRYSPTWKVGRQS
ncbi:hypothetical protein IW262DRAFT_1405484 [Armillaria fumosa]|nr:hypothetical protein IW262DRAFT_1405484 [Armillaria fumosa]